MYFQQHMRLEVVGQRIMTGWLPSSGPTRCSRLVIVYRRWPPNTSPPALGLFLWLTLHLLPGPLAALASPRHGDLLFRLVLANRRW